MKTSIFRTFHGLIASVAIAAALAACSNPGGANPSAGTKPSVTVAPTSPKAAAVTPSTPVAAVPVADPHLIHRYSFTADARDSAGKVNGALKGGAKIVNGQVVLDNGSKGSDDPTLSYVAFESSTLPKGDSVSIVFWFTGSNTAGFSRILDIGDREGIQGRAFIYFTPATGGTGTPVARAAITANITSDKTALDFVRIDDGKPHAVAMVIDGKEKKLHVFLDGKEANPAVDLGVNTLDKVRPVNNWLGRSLYGDQDIGLTGSIDEFRVYDVALSAAQAAAIATAGPDKVPSTR